MVSQASTLASPHTTSKRNKSYDVTESNEQHQFDILYIPHNLFEGNAYILTGIDVASRYKVGRPLKTKKSSEVAFVLKSVFKKSDVFKYPEEFWCDNGSEFKNEVTKLLEKNSVHIRRATTKYKHTHTPFVEAFNKRLGLAKLFFKTNGCSRASRTRKNFHNLG